MVVGVYTMLVEEECSIVAAHRVGANVYKVAGNEKGRSVFWVCDAESKHYPVTSMLQGFFCPCIRGIGHCVHTGAVLLYLFPFTEKERAEILLPKVVEKRSGFSLLR